MLNQKNFWNRENVKLCRRIARETLSEYLKHVKEHAHVDIHTEDDYDRRGLPLTRFRVKIPIDLDYRWRGFVVQPSKLISNTKEEISIITFKKDTIDVYKLDVYIEIHNGHKVNVIRKGGTCDKFTLADPKCFDKIKAFFEGSIHEDPERR